MHLLGTTELPRLLTLLKWYTLYIVYDASLTQLISVFPLVVLWPFPMKDSHSESYGQRQTVSYILQVIAVKMSKLSHTQDYTYSVHLQRKAICESSQGSSEQKSVSAYIQHSHVKPCSMSGIFGINFHTYACWHIWIRCKLNLKYFRWPDFNANWPHDKVNCSAINAAKVLQDDSS